MPAGRILVVDDEEDTITAIGYCLTQEGFTVLEARDGQEALNVALQENPDVIVLDVMLPSLNGYEVSRKIKEANNARGGRSPKILLLTARRVDSLEREEFLAAWSQSDGVIYKPFEMEELLRQITRLCAVMRSHTTQQVAPASTE